MRLLIITFYFLMPLGVYSQYTGTASVTQGKAQSLVPNLFVCTGARVSGVGTIRASDNTSWTVPSETQFANTQFPFASDLYNSCNGALFLNEEAATGALSASDIVTIDEDGEIITAFIFADNYFELYINGIPAGKDKVPFTPFNSSIVQFKVKRPFTIAMLVVDWEENLGLGSELNGGFAYHPGDGGMVAVFKDAGNQIIAKTDSSWKAQVFYSSPITHISCPKENGQERLTSDCSTQDSNNGLSYYGLHWKHPEHAMDVDFNDTMWPNAHIYSNAEVGINNKPAYTNFTDIFDIPGNDAPFIWTSNIILDNEIIVRYRVPATNSIKELPQKKIRFEVVPNPSSDYLQIDLKENIRSEEILSVSIYSFSGELVQFADGFTETMDIRHLKKGSYLVCVKYGQTTFNKIIIKN